MDAMVAHTAHTFELWVALLSGLPFPIWFGLALLVTLYVIEKR